MDALDLVKEIAEENPIRAELTVNVCAFCDKSWAEGNFENYLITERRLEELGLKTAYIGSWSYDELRLKWEHHDNDCLWVRANKIVRNYDSSSD